MFFFRDEDTTRDGQRGQRDGARNEGRPPTQSDREAWAWRQSDRHTYHGHGVCPPHQCHLPQLCQALVARPAAHSIGGGAPDPSTWLVGRQLRRFSRMGLGQWDGVRASNSKRNVSASRKSERGRKSWWNAEHGRIWQEMAETPRTAGEDEHHCRTNGWTSAGLVWCWRYISGWMEAKACAIGRFEWHSTGSPARPLTERLLSPCCDTHDSWIACAAWPCPALWDAFRWVRTLLLLPWLTIPEMQSTLTITTLMHAFAEFLTSSISPQGWLQQAASFGALVEAVFDNVSRRSISEHAISFLDQAVHAREKGSVSSSPFSTSSRLHWFGSWRSLPLLQACLAHVQQRPAQHNPQQGAQRASPPGTVGLSSWPVRACADGGPHEKLHQHTKKSTHTHTNKHTPTHTNTRINIHCKWKRVWALFLAWAKHLPVTVEIDTWRKWGLTVTSAPTPSHVPTKSPIATRVSLPRGCASTVHGWRKQLPHSSDFIPPRCARTSTSSNQRVFNDAPGGCVAFAWHSHINTQTNTHKLSHTAWVLTSPLLWIRGGCLSQAHGLSGKQPQWSRSVQAHRSTHVMSTYGTRWKSEELKPLLQVYTQQVSVDHKKYDYYRLKLTAQRHLEQKIKDSHFVARNRDEDRSATGAPEKDKEKGKAKHNSERGVCLRWMKNWPTFVSRFVRFRACQAEDTAGRDVSDHLLRKAHRAETQEATEKVVLTEVREKALPKFLGKVRQEDWTGHHAQTSRAMPDRKFGQLCACPWMCKVKNSGRVHVRKQVCLPKPFGWARNCRMARRNFGWSSIISRKSMFRTRQMGPPRGVHETAPKNDRIPNKCFNLRGTIQRMDLASWRKGKDLSLAIAQKCAQNSKIVLSESMLILQTGSYEAFEGNRVHCGFRSSSSYDQ